MDHSDRDLELLLSVTSPFVYHSYTVGLGSPNTAHCSRNLSPAGIMRDRIEGGTSDRRRPAAVSIQV